MKATRSLLLPLTLLSTALLFGEPAPVHGDEDYSDRLLRSFHLPLVQNYGHVAIYDVPITLHFEKGGLVDVAAAMSAPVFSVSSSPKEAQRDVNLISLSKIKVSAEYLDQKDDEKGFRDAEANWIIDVSKFEQPTETNIELPDIIQEILVCLRFEYPPSHLGKVHIVIRGAQEAMGLSKFEGLLWQTTRDKMFLKQR